jgi:hypothetical protein
MICPLYFPKSRNGGLNSPAAITSERDTPKCFFVLAAFGRRSPLAVEGWRVGLEDFREWGAGSGKGGHGLDSDVEAAQRLHDILRRELGLSLADDADETPIGG